MLIIHLKKNKLTPHNSRKTLKQKNPEIKKQWAWISLNLSGADITSVLTAAQPVQLSCPLEAGGGSYKAVEEAGAEGWGAEGVQPGEGKPYHTAAIWKEVVSRFWSLPVVTSNRTRGNSLRLHWERLRLYIGKFLHQKSQALELLAQGSNGVAIPGSI